MSIRSLRMEYSTWSSSALSRRSGGIDGRPVWEYSFSKSGHSRPRTSSTIVRIARSGWSFGTRCAGEM